MDLGALEPAIEAWATALLGGDVPVAWADRPPPQGVRRLALLSVLAVAGTGVDDVVRVLDAEAPTALTELVPEVRGYRLLTVSIQVDTLDQRASGTARALLEQARTRAQAPSVLGLLHDAGLALVAVGDAVPAPYKLQGRTFSRYVLDVRLAAGARERDAAGATSTIESAELRGELTDTDGSPLPAALQGVP